MATPMVLEQEETDRREKWQADALGLIEQFANRGRPFTSDDLYQAGLRAAPHPNMAGPLFNHAVALNLITPTGKVNRSRRKSRRGGWVAEYVGTQITAAAA